MRESAEQQAMTRFLLIVVLPACPSIINVGYCASESFACVSSMAFLLRKQDQNHATGRTVGIVYTTSLVIQVHYTESVYFSALPGSSMPRYLHGGMPLPWVLRKFIHQFVRAV